MASFAGIEIWSEVSAVGVRKAAFTPDHDLASAVLRQSLTNPESLTFAIPRTHDAAGEIVHGRIARVCWSDTTLDTEWRIADVQDQSGADDTGIRTVTCQALLLDLARATYITHDSAGRPAFSFSATQLTPTEWLAYVVTACARLPYTVSVGTVEWTAPFDLAGEFATALEIVRAIQQPGRAPGDVVFRRNGTTDYKLDLLTSRGSSAAVVRVQTARNLLAHQRTVTFDAVATRVVPRGKSASATRDLSQTYWKVASVDSGTTATLADPYGGAGPSAFTDQLKNLYVARIASTFSSQQVSASTTGGQITVPSTTGWAAGDFVRFFTTSGSAGKRLVALDHPTRVLAPSAGGYGPVERILQFDTGFGDANLLTNNAWLATWTTASNAPDGFTRSSTAGGTWSRETGILAPPGNTYSQKIALSTSAVRTETTRFISPTATPYTTSGLRFAASAWYRADVVSDALQRYVRLRIMKPDLSVSYADGDIFDPADAVGQWVKLSLENVDLSAATSGVVVVVEVSMTNDPNGYAYHTSYFGPMTLAEADVPIADVRYSGGIAMWQRANVLLDALSAPQPRYTVGMADLARLDGSAWAAEPLILGGTIEVTDTDLALVTTQRVVELGQDLLRPLATDVMLAAAPASLVGALAHTADGSTISGIAGGEAPDGRAPAAAPQVIGDLLTAPDVYTKAEVDALLAGKLNIGGVGMGGGTPLTIGAITYSALGPPQTVATGLSPTQLSTLSDSLSRLHIVFGANESEGAFVDLVAVCVSAGGTKAIATLSTTDVRGTPRTRSYTMNINRMQLALLGASGTDYTVTMATISTPQG